MLNGKASELDCKANDLACLCKSKDFAYGLRDCSVETCGSDEATKIVEYGIQICKSKSLDHGVHETKLTSSLEAGVTVTDAPTSGSPTVSVLLPHQFAMS